MEDKELIEEIVLTLSDNGHSGSREEGEKLARAILKLIHKRELMSRIDELNNILDADLAHGFKNSRFELRI